MIAHIAGLPLEETVVSLGPALLVALGAGQALMRRGLASRLKRFSPAEREGAPSPRSDHSNRRALT